MTTAARAWANSATVKAVAERWAGGGKPTGGPNVYDTLMIPRERQ